MSNEEFAKIQIKSLKEVKFVNKSKDTETQIHIKTEDIDSAEIIKNHYKNLKSGNQYVVQMISPEALKRWQEYDKLAFIMRQEGYNTKIREGKKDYLLLAKKKDDKTPWNQVAPRIAPFNLPMFEVGRLSEETIKTIRIDENKRIKRKIRKNGNDE